MNIQGKKAGIFNCSPTYYNKNYGLIIQFNVTTHVEDTIAAIHNWPERKNKLFKNGYIQIAYDHLDTFYGKSKLSAGL